MAREGGRERGSQMDCLDDDDDDSQFIMNFVISNSGRWGCWI